MSGKLICVGRETYALERWHCTDCTIWWNTQRVLNTPPEDRCPRCHEAGQRVEVEDWDR